MKVGDLIYDNWANLTGIVLQTKYNLDAYPWSGMKWDYKVLYADGDIAGANMKDLQLIRSITHPRV